MAPSIRTSSPGWRACRWLAIASVCLGLSSAGSPDGSVPAAVRPVPQIEPIRPIPSPEPMGATRIDLGLSLFEDPRLSHGGDRSRSSCHNTASNGAVARARDSAPDSQAIRTNTDTVFNAALSFRLDWVGDAHSLTEQTAGSLRRSDLTATTPDEVTRKLQSDPARASAFRIAYDGRAPNWADLLDALATYEKTLVTPHSRFDLCCAGRRMRSRPTNSPAIAS
ncbi:MAG: cytochrome-c peroxidase [Janthinobacterium lividum]